jgi:hypothetical protein
MPCRESRSQNGPHGGNGNSQPAEQTILAIRLVTGYGNPRSKRIGGRSRAREEGEDVWAGRKGITIITKGHEQLRVVDNAFLHSCLVFKTVVSITW